MNAITSPENGNKARSSEADVWAAVLQDLTDCVKNPIYRVNIIRVTLTMDG